MYTNLHIKWGRRRGRRIRLVHVRSIPRSFGMYKENLRERVLMLMIHPDSDFCVHNVLVRNPPKSSYMRPQDWWSLIAQCHASGWPGRSGSWQLNSENKESLVLLFEQLPDLVLLTSGGCRSTHQRWEALVEAMGLCCCYCCSLATVAMGFNVQLL